MSAKAKPLSIDFLNNIFDQDEGVYSKDALLLQDILRYPSSVDRAPKFKFIELARWLIENNKEFRDYYAGSHDTMTSRIAKRRQRIQGAIDRLRGMGLMLRVGTAKAEKNQLDTPIYDLSRNGWLMSSIVHINDNKYSKVENIQVAYEQFYDILEDLLSSTIKESYPSHVVLIRKMLMKIKSKSLVSEFANEVIKTLHSQARQDQIDSVETLQVLLTFPYGLAEIGSTSLWELWNECLSEMKADERQRLLYHYKIQIESYWTSLHSGEQERVLLSNAGNFSKATVKCYCYDCEKSAGTPVDIVELLELEFKYRNEKVEEGQKKVTHKTRKLEARCQLCGSNEVRLEVAMPNKAESTTVWMAPNWWNDPIEYVEDVARTNSSP